MTTPYHPLREKEHQDKFPWNLPDPPPPADPSENWLDAPIPLPDTLSPAHRRHDWNRKNRNQPRNPRERVGFRKTTHDDLRRIGYLPLRDGPDGEDTDDEQPELIRPRKRRERSRSPLPPAVGHNRIPGGLVRWDRVQEVRRVEDQLPAPEESDVRNSAAVRSGRRLVPGAARGVQGPTAMQPPSQTVAAAVESSIAAQGNGGNIPGVSNGQPIPPVPSGPRHDLDQLESRVSGPGAPGPSGSSYSAFAPLPQRSIPSASNGLQAPGRSNGMHPPGTAVGSGAPAAAPGGSIPGVSNGPRGPVLPNGHFPSAGVRGSSNLTQGAHSSNHGSLNGLYRPGQSNGLPPAPPNSPAALDAPMPTVGSSIPNAPFVPCSPGQLHHQPPPATTWGSDSAARVARPQQQRVREGK